MNGVELSILISVCGFLLSLAGAFFVAGWRWGTLRTDVDYIKRDVSEIRALFTLTFVEEAKKRGSR